MADSLARKVAVIADECAYVQKDGRNDFHRYRYASAAAVLAKVNESMAKHGVCSTVDPEVLSESEVNGNRTVTVKVRLTLHDADSDQTLATAGIGCGQDKGDKAVMKAQTAAIKYAWMLALNISTGDDPEADEDTDKQAAAPPRQLRPPRVEPPSVDTTARELPPEPRLQAPLPNEVDLGDSRVPPFPADEALWKRAAAAVDYAHGQGFTDVKLPDSTATAEQLTAFLDDTRQKCRAQKAKAAAR